MHQSGGERTYLFAVRTDDRVHACACAADRADAYVMDLRSLLESWTRDVGMIVEFSTIGDAGAWLRNEFSDVVDWQDRSNLYARHAPTCINDAISAAIPMVRTKSVWPDRYTQDIENAAHAAPATT